MSKSEMNVKAKLALSFLQNKTRDDGTRFVCRKDDVPDWLDDLCRDAHDDMLPDDFVFETIQEALTAIEDNDGETDDIFLEADCYTSDLLAWLGSHSRRVGYVDEAVSEMGIDPSEGIISQISAGQAYEKRQIFGNVVNSLENVELEEMDDLE